jgi:hypothetical protein
MDNYGGLAGNPSGDGINWGSQRCFETANHTLQYLPHQPVANGVIVEAVLVQLDHVLRRLFWHVHRPPALGQGFVDHHAVFVQPQDGDVEIHEHHMDGGVGFGSRLSTRRMPPSGGRVLVNIRPRSRVKKPSQ